MGGRKVNHPDQWVRVDNAIEPVIDRRTFEAAQLLLRDGWRFTDNEMLDYLSAAWCVNGYLSAPRMYDSKFTPTPVSYRDRFGSLYCAYKLIGYRTVHPYRYSRYADLVRSIHREIICKLTSMTAPYAGRIVFSEQEQTLKVDEYLRVAVVVLPFLPRSNTVVPGWKIHFDRLEDCDAILVSRMDKTNAKILDQYLFPRSLFTRPSHCFTDATVSAYINFKLRSFDDICSALKSLQNCEIDAREH
jgi:hypothetical protein